MASSSNSVITGKFKGSLGKELVFREWAGKTIVAKSPKARTGDPTDAQAVIQEKFQFATRYAKAIMKSADQSLSEAYASALRPRQNVFARAVEDFMSVPVVKSIDTRNFKGAAGDKIVVRASDDFRVTGVQVSIFAPDGSLLETGKAVQNLTDIDWTFTSTQTNSVPAGSKISAIATDIPGNEGILEVTF